MIPELVDIGLTDAQAVEAIQRAYRCMTRDETEAKIGQEAAARQNADDALTAAVAQLNNALLNYAKRQDLNAEIAERTAGFAAHEAALAAVTAAGAKNLLHFDGVGTSGDVYTHNGITFTLNPDMTVTATGTASANAYAYIKLNGDSVAIDDFCDGNHILSGCPANGSAGTYRLYVGKTGYRKDDTGSGVLLSDREDITGITIAPYVSAGYAIPSDAPLVFKPMIRRAEITDDSFQPYAPTNRELYEMILALQSGAAVQSVQSPMRNMGTDRPEVSEDA